MEYLGKTLAFLAFIALIGGFEGVIGFVGIFMGIYLAFALTSPLIKLVEKI